MAAPKEDVKNEAATVKEVLIIKNVQVEVGKAPITGKQNLPIELADELIASGLATDFTEETKASEEAN